MFKSSSSFDKLLDKATSLSNLEPDWASILQICDAIRQNDVQPKYALGAIKKKLYVTNPNVVLMTLQVLESCVKNCGAVFHNEVATKAFMDDIHDIYRTCSDVNVREQILKLVQGFAHAFRNEPSYRACQDLMKTMKAEGSLFPAVKDSDAMFSANTAPEWADGECCHRCRVQFTLVIRKHHCRNCGQVFCAKCTMKTSAIPKFGIEKEVRVCDVCYDKINKKSETKPSEEKIKTTSTANAPTSSSTPNPNKKSEQEIQEEEELQLALALSKSEAESKERERMRYSQFSTPKVNSSTPSSNSVKHKKSSKSKTSKSSTKKTSKTDNGENEDPELARYLNREYWEQRTTSYADYEPSPSPSAPQPSLTVSAKAAQVETIEPKVFKDKLATSPNDNDELEAFTNTLRSTIEIFVNRLNSNKLRGRPITNDNGVQSLFMNLTNMHSQLIMHTQQVNEERTNCERLQDKISQIRDARAALDALREEHREQMRRAAEEAERIRQQQMAQKLEIMRKKKQEYLQYQQQLALQRMQEQELLMRNEQFKQFNSNILPGAMPQNVVMPQWNNTPNASNYYVPNQSFANPMPNQQAMGNQPPPQQPVVAGQYVQANMPTNPHMVASHQPPMPNSVAPMSVPVQGPIPQVMPQFAGPMAPNMYMPGIPPNYQQQPDQNIQPPNMYQMAQPPATVAAAAPIANHQTQPQAPEAKEELLINFD